MNELVKLGLDPALPRKKLLASLEKDQKNTIERLKDDSADPRQRILLHMHLEDIRKAKQSFPPSKHIWPPLFLVRFKFFDKFLNTSGKSSRNTLPATLSLLLALLPVALVAVPASIVPDFYHDNRAVFDVLLTSIVLSTSLAALVTGVWSLFVTEGAIKRKAVGIGLGILVSLPLILVLLN